MKKLLALAAVTAISMAPAIGQNEQSSAVPGTLSEQAPVDPGVGKGELKYVEADGYMNKKKFWSDDTALVAAILGGVALVGGGVFLVSRKKKAE
jgi:LPXTG-motif cell wall-anchored protein